MAGKTLTVMYCDTAASGTVSEAGRQRDVKVLGIDTAGNSAMRQCCIEAVGKLRQRD